MTDTRFRPRALIATALLMLAGLFSGCAHNNPRDPLEPFNRGMYAFNDVVDQALVKPLAQGYRAVLPQVARTGITNFFSNLDDVTVLINNVLQLKIPQAASDAGRLLINTTLGVLGFVDVATHLGLEKHIEDFGQTLGYWGLDSGPYLVLPFFGPSSLRDGVGRLADSYSDPMYSVDHIRTRNQVLGVRALNNRELLLDSERILETAAIDRYVFIRDAYLQRRRNLVYDGNPPPEPLEDELEPAPRSEPQMPSRSMLATQHGGASPETPKSGATRTEPTPSSKPAASPGAPIVPVQGDSGVAPLSAIPVSPASPPQAQVVKVWLHGSTVLH